ncbi:hypothetical protein vseg_011944 [Gypsophila vaccaria]
MHQIKTCTLKLANLGKPMDPDDIIAKVLRGLDPTHYRAIKEMVEARDTPISFDALHKKLINHDLKHHENSLGCPKTPTSLSTWNYPPRTSTPSTQLDAFSDADWAGDRDGFLSTSGYLVYLGKNPIS